VVKRIALLLALLALVVPAAASAAEPPGVTAFRAAYLRSCVPAVAKHGVQRGVARTLCSKVLVCLEGRLGHRRLVALAVQYAVTHRVPAELARTLSTCTTQVLTGSA
jgi:hypothetical protein